MLNRLMKNERSFSFPVISGNYPAQNNKYFFGQTSLFHRYNFESLLQREITVAAILGHLRFTERHKIKDTTGDDS